MTDYEGSVVQTINNAGASIATTTYSALGVSSGAHMVERVNVRGRSGLAAFDQAETPRYYPTVTPENAGAAHVRIHQATRDAGIGIREGSNAALSDAELLARYKQAYSDPKLQGIRGDLRTPDGNTVIARDVTPAEAYKALQKWFAEQAAKGK